ncbi:predicted protein [Uncinocarpus reesii 1704]|uniref:Uncharacterized protein n=1 Tax=Uncinocarpus reesii (strain UAMH 1704) TaxID=336963 RepID=C4JZB4_UNCRE|nr:uncharacterized protein UREG_07515 [Uncinocarpus reesii 1704]EEP82650.1 predicted protein [Uncinocarpus reesii 1704]
MAPLKLLSFPELPNLSLDAAGLVALADIATLQERTALMGRSQLLDALVVCPGIHRQQMATSLNGGEYPVCGSLTDDYVFRVENPATVFFLQKVSRSGHLTPLWVSLNPAGNKWYKFLGLGQFTDTISAILYFTAVTLAVGVIIVLALSRDWWGLSVILLLVVARFINILVIHRRSVPGWFGVKEEGRSGDLLILLSQDRWVRLRGAVDDLKAVTAGQWMRDPQLAENWISAVATVIVYLDAALASNASQLAKILILALLIISVGLLAVVNSRTDSLQMHGRIIKLDGEPKSYERRLKLAEELIRETGRRGWALRMGMVVDDEKCQKTDTNISVEEVAL